VSRWLLDFVGGADDAIAGFVRLELRPEEQIAWYWTYLVGVPDVDGVLVVRDHEVLLPRQALEIRAEGLWAELVCEKPREHWTFGLESFGVRLDEPGAALRAGGEIGERIAVGLDIEWEVGDVGPPAGTVHGDVLVGRARHAISGPGWFYDDGADDPGWIAGDPIATVYIPVAGTHIERPLVRTDTGPRWSLDRRRNPR
jgi:hypothetical protein